MDQLTSVSNKYLKRAKIKASNLSDQPQWGRLGANHFCDLLEIWCERLNGISVLYHSSEQKGSNNRTVTGFSSFTRWETPPVRTVDRKEFDTFLSCRGIANYSPLVYSYLCQSSGKGGTALLSSVLSILPNYFRIAAYGGDCVSIYTMARINLDFYGPRALWGHYQQLPVVPEYWNYMREMRFNILLWTLQHFIIAKRCFSLIVSEEAPCLRFLYAGSRLGSTDCQIFDVESRLGNGLSQKSFKSSNFPPPDHNWELNFIVTQPTSPPASHISEIFSTDLSEILLLLTILCSRRKKSSEWRCWLPWRGFSSKFWTICQTRESLRVLIPTEWTVTNSIIVRLGL